jgi:hypothetical protein
MGGGLQIGQSALEKLRLTALRAHYTLRLVTNGFNVLSVDTALHFKRDPYVAFKAAPHVSLFVGSDACSLTDRGKCCDGTAFPCTNQGFLYAQKVNIQ